MKSLPDTRTTVLVRDGFRCVAPQIDGRAGWCRDAFGTPISRWSGRDPGPKYLQMSHTKGEGELSMGKKAEYDIWHLVSLCPGHHTGTVGGSNWEAVHRNEIRRYIIEANEPGQRSRQGAQSSRR